MSLENETVWQVVPLSRPDCVRQVIAGFASQLHPDRKLCLVANGPRVDEVLMTLSIEGAQPDLLLTSAPGKPAALNTAFEVLRGQMIAIRDDDDIQLPGDLAECVAAMDRTGAEIISRHKHWVWSQDSDRLWLLGEHLAHSWADQKISGGSLLFRCDSDTPPIPDQRVGECCVWAAAMIELGARIWRPSINHQIFVRGRGDHLFEADENYMAAVYARGPTARLYGNPTSQHQVMCRGALKPDDLPHRVMKWTQKP